MPYTLIIKQGARQDILDAFLYYEEQQAGLGEQFLAEVAASNNRIVANPEYYGFIATKQHRGLRRLNMNTFPYIIIYEIENDRIVVYAVHNTHQKPRRL